MQAIFFLPCSFPRPRHPQQGQLLCKALILPCRGGVEMSGSTTGRVQWWVNTFEQPSFNCIPRWAQQGEMPFLTIWWSADGNVEIRLMHPCLFQQMSCFHWCGDISSTTWGPCSRRPNRVLKRNGPIRWRLSSRPSRTLLSVKVCRRLLLWYFYVLNCRRCAVILLKYPLPSYMWIILQLSIFL